MVSNPYPNAKPRCETTARHCIAPGIIRINGKWLCADDAKYAVREPICVRGLVQHDADVRLHNGTCYCPFTPNCKEVG